MRRLRLACGIATMIAIAAPSVRALETDQYYAFDRTLEDAGDAINAEVNSEIAAALEKVNARGAKCTCKNVQSAIRRRFTYPIFLKTELWTTNTSLVHKVPEGKADELRFRREYVYAYHTSPLDVVRWMPPSPTIEVAGIRFGTDKLSHFFSEGAFLNQWYRSMVRKGIPREEAIRRAVLRGVTTERTVLGGTSSGVMSLADLEANYQGLLFWSGLCDPADPALKKTPAGWVLTRPFDLAPLVSPEWDESWQPNVYLGKRWKKVRPYLARFCGALDHPAVAARRTDYARRDTFTPSEAIVSGLLAEGRIPDPSGFTIDAVCGLPLRDVLHPPGSGPKDPAPARRTVVDIHPGAH